MEKIKTKNSGFTLLEILITLAISGLVVTAALQVFQNSNESYIVQEDVAQMQQNVRMAKYYIERDLRMAGYGLGTIGVGGLRVLPFEFENNKNATDFLPNGDVLTIRYITEDDSACGATPPVAAGVAGSCSALPQLNLKGGMPESSSEATIVQDFSVAPFSLWDQDCWCGNTVYTQPTPGYAALITSPDGSKSDIVFITQVQNTGGDDKLQNRPYLTYDNKVINSYPDGSTIKFFNMDSFTTLKYYVDSNYKFIQEKNGNKVTIAENIEDFQVSFFGDFNDDKTLNLETVEANKGKDWLQDNSAVSIANIDKIRFVKTSLLARTSREHKKSGIQTTRPALENNPAATTSDYYKRRDISVTVRIRNLGI